MSIISPERPGSQAFRVRDGSIVDELPLPELEIQ